MSAENQEAPGRKAARRLARGLGYISERSGISPPQSQEFIDKDSELSRAFAEGKAIQQASRKRRKTNSK